MENNFFIQRHCHKNRTKTSHFVCLLSHTSGTCFYTIVCLKFKVQLPASQLRLASTKLTSWAFYKWQRCAIIFLTHFPSWQSIVVVWVRILSLLQAVSFFSCYWFPFTCLYSSSLICWHIKNIRKRADLFLWLCASALGRMPIVVNNCTRVNHLAVIYIRVFQFSNETGWL